MIVNQRRRRGLFGRSIQIPGKRPWVHVTQVSQDDGVLIHHLAPRVRRHIQQQGGIRPNRFLGKGDPFVERPDSAVFARRVKSPGSNRRIHFSRIPDQILDAPDHCATCQVLIARVHVPSELTIVYLLGLLLSSLLGAQIPRNQTPLGPTTMASLVSAPTNIRFAYPNDRVRLQCTNRRNLAVPIVNLSFAVRPLAAGSVKPDTKDVSIVGQ